MYRLKNVAKPTIAISEHELNRLQASALPWVYEHRTDTNFEDCLKTQHLAVNADTGQVKEIDHSPYEEMSPHAFLAHVKLRFPPRPTLVGAGGSKVSAPWKNQSIKNALKQAPSKTGITTKSTTNTTEAA